MCVTRVLLLHQTRRPPPITTRAIQQMQNANNAFQHTRIISETPFPFAFAQLCIVLLYVYAATLPVVLCVYVPHAAIASVLGVAITLGFFATNEAASEIENPFDGGTSHSCPIVLLN